MATEPMPNPPEDQGATPRTAQHGSYAVIPVEVLTDPALHGAPVRVFGLLTLYTDKHGVCWPSQATLAKRIGVTAHAIAVAIKALVDRGHVLVLPEEDHRKVHVRTRYRLRRPGESGWGVHNSLTDPLRKPVTRQVPNPVTEVRKSVTDGVHKPVTPNVPGTSTYPGTPGPGTSPVPGTPVPGTNNIHREQPETGPSPAVPEPALGPEDFCWDDQAAPAPKAPRPRTSKPAGASPKESLGPFFDAVAALGLTYPPAPTGPEVAAYQQLRQQALTPAEIARAYQIAITSASDYERHSASLVFLRAKNYAYNVIRHAGSPRTPQPRRGAQMVSKQDYTLEELRAQAAAAGWEGDSYGLDTLSPEVRAGMEAAMAAHDARDAARRAHAQES